MIGQDIFIHRLQPFTREGESLQRITARCRNSKTALAKIPDLSRSEIHRRQSGISEESILRHITLTDPVIKSDLGQAKAIRKSPVADRLHRPWQRQRRVDTRHTESFRTDGVRICRLRKGHRCQFLTTVEGPVTNHIRITDHNTGNTGILKRTVPYILNLIGEINLSHILYILECSVTDGTDIAYIQQYKIPVNIHITIRKIRRRCLTVCHINQRFLLSQPLIRSNG